MSDTQQQSSREPGDHDATTYSVGTPSNSQQPDIADLANDFSRLGREPGAADAKSMSREGRRHGLGAVVGDDSHASTDAEVSSDEWQSPGSGDETGDGDPFDHGRLEVVDRIMKSFCTSLDSKIAVIMTSSSPAIKNEREATEPTPEAIRTTTIPGRRGRSSGGGRDTGSLPPFQPPPHPALPSNLRSLSQRGPALSALPPSGFKRRRGISPSHPSVATDLDRGHVQPFGLPQSRNIPTAGAETTVPGSSLGGSLLCSTREDEAFRPVSNSPAAEILSGLTGAAAEHSPAREQRAADHLDSLLTPSRGYPSATGRPKRRASRRASRRSVLDSTISREEPPDAQDEQAGALVSANRDEGQGLPIGAARYRISVTDSDDEDNIRAPAEVEALFPDNRDVGQGQPISGAFYRTNATDSDDEYNFLAAAEAGTMPESYSYTASSGPELPPDFDRGIAWAPDVWNQPSPSWPAPDVLDLFGSGPVHLPQTSVRPAGRESQETPEGQQESQRIKRPAEPETQQDLVHVHEEPDGDGRRKKAKRVLDTVGVAENGRRKFACPYFKRNPKKYRKWTSCPGPGWDEVHRVKYGCQLAWQCLMLTSVPGLTSTDDTLFRPNALDAGKRLRRTACSSRISSKTHRAPFK